MIDFEKEKLRKKNEHMAQKKGQLKKLCAILPDPDTGSARFPSLLYLVPALASTLSLLSSLMPAPAIGSSFLCYSILASVSYLIFIFISFPQSYTLLLPYLIPTTAITRSIALLLLFPIPISISRPRSSFLSYTPSSGCWICNAFVTLLYVCCSCYLLRIISSFVVAFCI